MPDAFSARLRERTGAVTDVRRLVVFIYLLIRDTVPLGVVGEAHHRATAYSCTRSWSVTGIEAKLVRQPTKRLCVFLEGLEGCDLTQALRQLSPDDDVECAFSNGFLARYAQLVADDLTADVTTT